jgi:branched-chain amino acid transport system ATP-binding protein
MSFSIEHVSKRFNGLAAVDDVSMRFEPGLIYAIIGPNGAGKSTLVNMAAGSYSVTSGSIVLDGTRLERLKKYQISVAGIARTYQNIRLFDQMQVIENLEVCLFADEARHIWQDVLMPGRARRRRAARLATCRTLLAQFGLADVEEQEARSLPYARQRMLEIARALVRQPKVLLLDEPAAGLNDAEMQELKDRLLRLRSDRLIIVVIEHNMNLVMSLSDHIYVPQKRNGPINGLAWPERPCLPATRGRSRADPTLPSVGGLPSAASLWTPWCRGPGAGG